MTAPPDATQRTPAPPRRALTVNLAVILIGGALSIGLFQSARTIERRERRLEFERAVVDRIGAIQLELDAQLHVLEAVRAGWNAAGDIDRADFRKLVHSCLDEYPTLQALEWAPVVPAAQRAAYEASAVGDGLAGFEFTERDEQGQLIRAGPRPLHYPVFFVEPLSGNEEALGYDLGSHPGRLRALDAAAETRDQQATEPLRLVQDDAGVRRSAFLSVLPVYTRGVPLDDTEDRRRNLQGFVVAVFRVDEIFERTFSALGEIPMEWVVTDRAAPAGQRLVHTSRDPATPASSVTPGDPAWVAEVLDVQGREWTARVRSLEPPPGPGLAGWLILGLGLLLTGLLSLYLRAVDARTGMLRSANVELALQVAERRAAEQRTLEAQRTLSTLISNLPGLAYRCLNDRNWTMEFLSDGCLELTGYHPRELLSGEISFGQTLIHPGDRERVWELVSIALGEGRPFQLIYRIVRKDGEERWVWEQGRGVEDEAGEMSSLEGFIADITIQKRVEQSLIKEKQFSDSTIDSLPGVFYLFNDRGEYLRWNKNLEQISGYTSSEVAKMSPLQLVAEEDRAEVVKRIEETFESGSSSAEASFLTRGGERIPYFFTGRRVTFDGTPCLIGMGVDITDRVRAESELKRERRMFIGGPVVVIRWAAVEGWPVEYVSPNVVQLFGYEAEELTGGRPSYFEVIHPEDRERVAEAVRTHEAAGDESYEQDYRIVRKDGEVRWLSDFTVLARDEQGEVTHHEGYVLDVTERRRAQEEREEILRKVLDTQKLESVGVLAGGIAHDFNNLLTSVLGNLSFALDRLGQGEARDFIEQARAASQRASDLTHQLLAYAGRASIERRPLDLSEHIREITHLLQASISKKVDLRLELGEGLPAVEADPAQIQQLVMNLVINAAEACGDEAGAVLVRTSARAVDGSEERPALGEPLEPGNYVVVMVEDTGRGMDAETVRRIFDPFFTTKFTGRGLGLAAALGIVRSHEGSLQVRSEPGLGSTFEVLLPASSRPAAPRESEQRPDLTGTGTILIADDEPAVLRVAGRALKEQGYDVLEAVNGRQAVEIFRSRPDDIALVLLDMTMPEMNGAEAFKAIHTERPDVPALLSSGYDEQEATEYFLGEGLAGFIQKPYTPAALAAKVKEILGDNGSS